MNNIFGQLLTTATPQARSYARAGVVTVGDLAAETPPPKDSGMVIVASVMGVVVLGATIAGAVVMTRSDVERKRRLNYR